jgi:hypothetical protein
MALAFDTNRQGERSPHDKAHRIRSISEREETMGDSEMVVIVAGLSDRNEMRFDLGRVRCGHIEDGIGIALPGEGSLAAGWVMAFEDLEAIYMEARAIREAAPND